MIKIAYQLLHALEVRDLVMDSHQSFMALRWRNLQSLKLSLNMLRSEGEKQSDMIKKNYQKNYEKLQEQKREFSE